MLEITDLNDSDLIRFRAMLDAMFVDLSEQDKLGKDSQNTVTLDQQSTGRLSRMDALQHQAMALAQQRRRNLNEAKILASIKRIDEGEFGYCVDCGEEIDPARLEIDPTTPRCMSCATG